ncbi:hypothetical protein [Rheinheimera pacifica]|uniref:hypothetical protein n=1 Tax=Rheinheimera pacifica TaxID=173990 RepID=UPI002ED97511
MVKLSILLIFMLFSSTSYSQGVVPIEDFVRQIFIKGVPYSEAIEYGDEDVPVLVKMLNDPRESEHWANIVVTLEIIGGDLVVNDVISFIERDPGKGYDISYHRAKMAAIMGLGYLINSSNNEKALGYLVDSLNPKIWDDRKVYGVSVNGQSYYERNIELSKQALLGLALAGTKKSAVEIKRFAEMNYSSGNAALSDFHRSSVNVIDELLKEHNRIQSKGMKLYKNEH